MFDGVDLEDSWGLGWRFDSKSNQLVFDLDVSLWQGHKNNTKPLPEEWTCYKRGALVFNQVSNVNGLLPMESVKYTVDLDGSIDYGNIEGFRKTSKDKYNFSGDFGEVSVTCSEVRLEINEV